MVMRSTFAESAKAANLYDEASGPEVVLALIADNERLTKAVGLQVIRRFVGDGDQKNIDELVAAGIQVDKELIAQLRAELQEAYSLIGGIVLAVGAPIEGELSGWVEALRRDAERYRWLRDSSESIHQFYLSTPIWFTGVKFSKENVDSTIDAAMSKEASHD